MIISKGLRLNTLRFTPCLKGIKTPHLMLSPLKTLQNKYKGAIIHAFFCFFPTNEQCQLKKFPLTKECTMLTQERKTQQRLHDKIQIFNI